jgi:hypothetical protein
VGSERDLLNWALMVVSAEEAARQVAKGVKVQVEPAKAKPPSTRIVDRRNVVLEGGEIVVQETGFGVLQEFMAKAESVDFQVLIEKDDETVVYGTYGEYAEVSQDLEGIDAFEERDAEGEPTGAYVFKVSDIEFAKGLMIKIKTANPVKFRVIFCKYKIV